MDQKNPKALEEKLFLIFWLIGMFLIISSLIANITGNVISNQNNIQFPIIPAIILIFEVILLFFWVKYKSPKDF